MVLVGQPDEHLAELAAVAAASNARTQPTRSLGSPSSIERFAITDECQCPVKSRAIAQTSSIGASITLLTYR